VSGSSLAVRGEKLIRHQRELAAARAAAEDVALCRGSVEDSLVELRTFLQRSGLSPYRYERPVVMVCDVPWG